MSCLVVFQVSILAYLAGLPGHRTDSYCLGHILLWIPVTGTEISTRAGDYFVDIVVLIIAGYLHQHGRTAPV